MQVQSKIHPQKNNSQKKPVTLQQKDELRIQSCFNCYQHVNQQNHDEEIYYQLMQHIKSQLISQNIDNIKIVKNKPFKYLYKTSKKDKEYKRNIKQVNHNYFNQILNKTQRFPKIGSFQVYYENFVIFSKLNSVYQIKISKNQTIEKQLSNSDKNQNLEIQQKSFQIAEKHKIIQQTDFLRVKQVQKVQVETLAQKDQSKSKFQQQTVKQNQNSQRAFIPILTNTFKQQLTDNKVQFFEWKYQISTRKLAYIIVSVIKIIKNNLNNVKFIQKVQNIFRFLQMQWKPISYKYSIVQYLLESTKFTQVQGCEAVLNRLIDLVSGNLQGFGINSSRSSSPKQINPYTYYQKKQKQSRIKIIYGQRNRQFKNGSSSISKSHSKSFSKSLSRSSHSKKSFIKANKKLNKINKINKNKLTINQKSKLKKQAKKNYEVNEKKIIETKISQKFIQNSTIKDKKVEQVNQVNIKPQQNINSKTQNLNHNYEQKGNEIQLKQKGCIERYQKKNNLTEQYRQNNLFELKQQTIQKSVKNLKQQSKPQGFIIKKKHYKRKSIPMFQQTIQPESKLRQSGFIYRTNRQSIKQKLLSNNLIFQNIQFKHRQSFKQECYIGKIFNRKNSSQRHNGSLTSKSNTNNEPNIYYKIQSYDKNRSTLQKDMRFTLQKEDNNKNINKIFKRVNKSKPGSRGANLQKSKNLVRNCFSQRKQRPLSSTIASRKLFLKVKQIHNSISVSQTQIKSQQKIEEILFTENKSTQNGVLAKHFIPKKDEEKTIKDYKNVRRQSKYQQTKKKREKQPQKEVELNANDPIKKLDAQKSPLRKYSKDFVKQNILKASKVKRINSYGLSSSYWQQGNKLNLIKSPQKKLKRWNSNKEKSLVHQRTFSYRENQSKEKIQQCCKKCDKRVSSFIQSQIKQVPNEQKSLKSYQSKRSKQNSQHMQQYQKKGLQNISNKNEVNNSEGRYTTSQLAFEKIPELNQQQRRDSVGYVTQNLIHRYMSSNFSSQINDVGNVNNSQQYSENNDRIQIDDQNFLPAHNQDQNSIKPGKQRQFQNYKISHASNIITYSMGSQQQQASKYQNQYLSSPAYYNHTLYLSLQSFIKYQPAFITSLLNYTKSKSISSKEFSQLLIMKNFEQLDILSKFNYEQEQIYQQFIIKSIRQIYKLDEVKLFPSNSMLMGSPNKGYSNSNNQNDLFHPSQIQSLYWQQTNSILTEVVYILSKMNRKIISRLFQNVKSVNYLGYYGVWLFDIVKNKFQLIIVNDQFPLKMEDTFNINKKKDFITLPMNSKIKQLNQFIFSNPLEQNSIWYMILEKAISKMLGGYKRIESCTFGQLFKMMTGCQYVQVKDFTPQKFCKMINEKILSNKKSYVYAIKSLQKVNCDNSQIQSCSSPIQRITGWNFNQKNPFLSLIHFQSSSNRIQSITMIDFMKQFDGITLIFFNPNFLFNQTQIDMQIIQKSNKKSFKVIQITSSSYNKQSTCYINCISAYENSQNKIEENDVFKNSRFMPKQQLKTNIKLYDQVHTYNMDNAFNNVKIGQQYQQDMHSNSFTYNGEITKNGQFFFEVALKGGRNLCLIQSQNQKINLSLYSEEKVQLRQLSQQQLKKIKLFGHKQNQKSIKDNSNKNTQMNQSSKQQNFGHKKSSKLQNIHKEIQQNRVRRSIFRQIDENQDFQHRNSKRISKNRKKQDKTQQLRQSQIVQMSRKRQFLASTIEKRFVEDIQNQNAYACKSKIKVTNINKNFIK